MCSMPSIVAFSLSFSMEVIAKSSSLWIILSAYLDYSIYGQKRELNWECCALVRNKDHPPPTNTLAAFA